MRFGIVLSPYSMIFLELNSTHKQIRRTRKKGRVGLFSLRTNKDKYFFQSLIGSNKPRLVSLKQEFNYVERKAMD